MPRSSRSLLNELMLIMFMVFALCFRVCLNSCATEANSSWTNQADTSVIKFINKLTFQPNSHIFILRQ